MGTDLTLNVTEQEIRWLADAIVAYSLSLQQQDIVQPEELNLEALASSLAGVLDPIGQLKDWIAGFFQSLSSVLTSTIQSLLDALRASVEGLIKGIQSSVSGLYDFIRDLFENLYSAVSSLSTALAGFIDQVRSVIEGLASRVAELASQITKAVESAVKGAVETITSAVSSLADTVKSWFSSIADALKKGFEGVLKYVSEQASAIIKTLEASVKSLSSAVLGAIKSLGEAVANLSKTVTSYIKASVETIIKALGSALSGVKAAIESIVSNIKGLMDVIKDIGDTVGKAFSTILDVIKELPGLIGEVVSKAFEEVKSVLKGVADAVRKAFESIKNTIASMIDTVTKGLKELASNVAGAFDVLKEWLEKGFSGIADALSKLSGVLKTLGANFTGFVNAILKFPEWFPKWFEENISKPISNAIKELSETIWENLPDAVKGAAEALKKFLGFLVEIITSPEKALGTLGKIAEGALKGLASLGSAVLDALKGVAKQLVELAKGAMDFLLGIAKEAVKLLGEVMGKAAETLSSFLTERHSPELFVVIGTPFARALVALFTPVTERMVEAWEAVTENPVKAMYEAMNALVVFLVGLVILKKIAPIAAKLVPDWILKLAPENVGQEIKARLGELADELAKMFDKCFPDVARYLIIGHMIWWAEPTRVITRYWLTDWLTIELPPINTTIEAMRRRFPGAKISEAYEFVEKQLRMGGIGKSFIKALFGLPEDAVKKFEERFNEIKRIFGEGTLAKYVGGVEEPGVIVFKDRFAKDRCIPTSVLFNIPSPSELARWLVRDVFFLPATYESVATAVGEFPDIARLRYMYSFEYPPPEKIWTFVMRGIAGLLWFEPPEHIKKVFDKEAEWLGAGKPIPPVELNYKADVLFKALNWYMKWRQYSNFSWFTKDNPLIGFDFTADSWLVLDVTAKVPDKIDARWMIKWGIYELLSREGINVTTPAIEIVRVCKDRPENEKVMLDLTLFCRMLQGLGYHPAYVPVIAVADAMNVLADERTLLRTGFINLYKEGFFTMETLEKLLSGFVIASFKVSYFDMKTGKWAGEKYVNVPVMFLPAERRLLELRAIFDRAVDLLRDYMKALSFGVRELIYSPKEAVELLKKYVKEKIDNWFKKETSEVSGRELELTVDEPWVIAFSEVWREYSKIEEYVRARIYARYLFWRLLYRFERGFVTYKEIEAFAEKIVKELRESPLVARLLVEVGEQMVEGFIRSLKARAVINLLLRRRISTEEAVKELTKLGLDEKTAKAYIEAYARPYSISLTSLGTLLELVPEALNYSVECLKLFGFNPEELKYWTFYVVRRPIRDELTLVRTRIYRALAEGVSLDDIVKLLKDYIANYTVENEQLKLVLGEAAKKLEAFYKANKSVFEAYAIGLRELVLYKLIAELEALSESAREYIPTPITLATIAEYVPEAVKFLPEVLEAKRIPKKWRPLWEKFVKARPIANDVRAVISAYERCLRYGKVPEEITKKVKELASRIGFTDIEWSCLKLRALLEELATELREARREYIPTPLTLASMAEVVPEARKFLEEVLKARHVPDKWKPLWEAYVKRRPLMDELRRLLRSAERLFERFYASEDEFKKILDKLKLVGWEEDEIELILNSSKLDRAYYAFDALVGTPRELAYMAEYSPSARQLVLKQVEEMIDALPVDQNTKQFLKKMWEEYIRIRPVYDEVRRYITELISDYAEGVIGDAELERELEWLKKWGVDDFEANFIKEIARKRRERYVLREARRRGYTV